ncbi:hypothetical protein X801_07978 [Opisthorchis viverrini]|uniref:MD-2-related lipid-recognition domain-containing protein n=1 Tax=Opisthorchis viverrini TaxID=6198 RepID=A0A1S8WP98_OPIVI|nr:hypothetical protein X801_07978 [Opisthorchis viverrini]
MHSVTLLTCCVFLSLSGTPYAVEFKDCAQSVSAGGTKVQAASTAEFTTIPMPDSDVCDHLTPACPVLAKGLYSYTYASVVRGETPLGRVTVQWELLDTKKDPFLCVQFEVQIV